MHAVMVVRKTILNCARHCSDRHLDQYLGDRWRSNVDGLAEAAIKAEYICIQDGSIHPYNSKAKI